MKTQAERVIEAAGRIETMMQGRTSAGVFSEVIADALAADADQDWKQEETVWTLDDGSKVRSKAGWVTAL